MNTVLNFLQHPKQVIMCSGAIIVTLILVLVGYRDYQSWLALGEGGLPANPWGWFQTTSIRPFLSDPLSMDGFIEDIGQPWDIKALAALPKRKGERPTIAPHPVPHRQITQMAAPSLIALIDHRFNQIVQSDATRLVYKTSATEKHHNAIWAQDPANINPHSLNAGEIAHVHVSDGSVHVILSPSDAKQVIENGWGELHGLSGFEPLMPCSTYMLLYAPRNQQEVDIIERIANASIVYTLHSF